MEKVKKGLRLFDGKNHLQEIRTDPNPSSSHLNQVKVVNWPYRADCTMKLDEIKEDTDKRMTQ